jgi:branched-chain amino acid transport system substrate-binding protein
VTTQARRRWLGLAALAATVIIATGCGSSSSSSTTTSSASASSTTSTAATTTPAASSGTGGAGAASVTNYLTYVDGKAGKANASLPPVTIGWVNQQGGQQVIGALATNGAQLAVKYINDQLGGIDGHPLVLSTCFITSAEEEGTTCAQKFLANKSISVVAV